VYRARLEKEAEFALKQTFAFCPYSPEGIFHLMDLLSRQGRWEDIRSILKTALKLDPYNDTFQRWLDPVENNVLAQKAQSFQQTMAQARALINAQKTNEAEAALDAVAQDAHADVAALVNISGMYAELGKTPKGVAVMQKLLAANPNDWEMWFHLARIQAMDGKAAESAAALAKAFALNYSDRLTNGTQIQNLHDFVRHDNSFDHIRTTAEFEKATK
jgi:predicted Zn-dependent protease